MLPRVPSLITHPMLAENLSTKAARPYSNASACNVGPLIGMFLNLALLNHSSIALLLAQMVVIISICWLHYCSATIMKDVASAFAELLEFFRGHWSDQLSFQQRHVHSSSSSVSVLMCSPVPGQPWLSSYLQGSFSR